MGGKTMDLALVFRDSPIVSVDVGNDVLILEFTGTL